MLSTRRTLRVEFGDCDPTGIVFHPHYLAWFDASVHALLRSAGVSLARLQEEFGIDGIPLAESRLKFHAPCRAGDEAVVETEVVAIHRCAFDLHQRLLKGDTLVVETFETRIWTVLDAEQKRIRAHPLPERMIKMLSGEEPSRAAI